jgi:hypothetical protein
MRDRDVRSGPSAWLCACLVLIPCAALAQQAGTLPQAAGEPADRAASSASSSAASSAAPAHAATAKRADDLEPAVDTSAEAARARAQSDGKQVPGGRAARKAVDHLELGTTDITGNRELPKVMYIVPWKRSDLGDLTGKPLNSLVDQTLEPVDRNVFERSNRYYSAVTAGAARPGGSTAAASQDAHRTTGAGSGSAVRDER